MNDFLSVSAEDYLKNPCGTLPMPLWKASRFAVPDGMIILHGRGAEWLEHEDELEKSYDDSPYFRLYHDLQNVRRLPAESGFSVRQIDAETEADFVAEFISRCYDGLDLTANSVEAWTKLSAFRPRLWVAVHSAATGACACVVVGAADKETGEGSVEWLQTLPQFRGRGAAKIAVNELLRRMQTEASFCTVSGMVNNLTRPELVYRSCGFSGGDIWHILTPKLPSKVE